MGNTIYKIMKVLYYIQMLKWIRIDVYFYIIVITD